MKVIVLGYSDDESRYSNMASKLLMQYKHEVVNINPRFAEELTKLEEGAHTVTLYIGSNNILKFKDNILKAAPKRVIFNPGTENDELIRILESVGVEVVIGCTLVMLKTDQF